MRPIKETDVRKLYPQLAARRKKGAKADDLAHWLYTNHGLTEPDGSPLSAKRVQSMMQRVGGTQKAGAGAGRARTPASPARKGRGRSAGPSWAMYALGIAALVVALGLLIALQQMT